MQTTMKSAKRILAMLLVFALVVGTAVGGGFGLNLGGSEVYASSYPTATVTYTGSYGGFLIAAPVTKTISANLAESKGYTMDSIPATKGVSLLDVLVQAHIDYFGEDDLANYLTFDGSSATNILNNGANAMALVNGVVATDGILAPWGGYNGLAFTDTPVYDGDTVEIIAIQDDGANGALNFATFFEYEGKRITHLNVEKGASVTLKLKQVGLYNLFYETSKIKTVTTAVEDMEVSTYLGSDSLGTTNEDGEININFATAGDFTLTIPGQDDPSDPTYFYSMPCLTVHVEDGELTNAQKAENEAQFLSWDDIRKANDSIYNVSTDLNGITSQGDATITWSSSNTKVISNTLKVTPDCYDNYVVTLTATVKVGSGTVKKAFNLQVYKDTDESHRPVAILTPEEQQAKIAEAIASLSDNAKATALDPSFFLQRDFLIAFLNSGGVLTESQRKAVLKQVQMDILTFEANKSSGTWSPLLKDTIILCALGVDPREVIVSGQTYNLLEVIYTAPTSCVDVYKAPFALMAYDANASFVIPEDANISKDYLLKFLVEKQAANGAYGGNGATAGDTAGVAMGMVRYTGYSSANVPAGAITNCITKAKEFIEASVPGSGDFTSPNYNAFVCMFYAMSGEDPTNVKKGTTGYPSTVDGLLKYYRGDGQGFKYTNESYNPKGTGEAFEACVVLANYYDNDAATKTNIFDFSDNTLATGVAWPDSKILSSIAVENSKDTYYAGEPGRAECITVTAIYTDGSSAVVHSNGMKNNPSIVLTKAASVAGSNKSIKVTYSETADGVKISKDATFPITVIANPASTKINVNITLSNKGALAKDKDGKEIAQTVVQVNDQNYNGQYDVDDVLYYANESLLKNTALYGYEATEGQYGLGITKLMADESGAYGYWLNNNSCWSLTDQVAANDYVTAWVYKDGTAWSDVYTAFSASTYNVEVGSALEVTLNEYNWDNSIQPYGGYATAPHSNAKLMLLGANNGSHSTAKTDANGKYSLSFAKAGTHYLVAYDDNGKIIPAVTKIVVGTGSSSATTPTVGDTVTFTLKGDNVHTGSLHKGTTYPTWIEKTVVELSSSIKTVGDVFKTVLDENGYSYEGLNKDYIKYITTPDGTELGEFTNGQNSGWLYSVNGEVPLLCLNDYVLDNGDDIVWYYTDDYTLDSGARASMGLKDKVEEAATETTTVSSNVETKATVNDGKATASVSASDVTKAIEQVNDQAKADTTGKTTEKEVVLEVKSTGNVDAVETTIPANAVNELAKADANVVVKTECGDIEIPAESLDNIATQAAGQELTINMESKKAAEVVEAVGADKIKEETGLEAKELENVSIVEVTITAGDKAITSFGGKKISLSLPADNGQVAGKSYKVLAISADGTMELMTGVCVIENGKKVVRVTSSHLTTFVVTGEEVNNPFTDVHTTDYFYNPVLWAVDNKVTSGISADTFAPFDGCTRAQMVTFLWRAAGKPWASANSHFSDVPEGAYYADAVEWAIAAGITKGIGETTFAPNDAVTREQLASFIYRYAQMKGQGFTGTWMFLLDFNDASSISEWADEAMHWCVMNGIITGKDGKILDPQGQANRAQIVTMLYRYFNL